MDINALISMAMEENNTQIKELERRLTEVEEKGNKLKALSGMVDMILYICGLVMLVILLEFVFNFNAPVRKLLFAAFNISALTLFIYFVYLYLFRKRNRHSREEHLITADETGASFAGLKDELKNVLQIHYDDFSAYSKGLAAAALSDLSRKCKNLDFTEAVNPAPVYKKFKTASIVLPVIIVLIFAVPPFHNALYRIVNFTRDFTPPQKYSFVIRPGNGEITKGGSLDITVELNDKSIDEIQFYTRASDESEFSGKAITKNLNDIFAVKNSNIQNSFTYYAYVDGVKSNEYNITVKNRPIITGFELKITPPYYAGMQQEYQSDNGNATVLTGTDISFSIASSKELKGAFIVLSDSTRTGLKVNGKKAGGVLAVKKDLTYHFTLVDEEGNENINPAEYTIKAIPDEYPVIQILSPEKNVEIGNVKLITLVARIKDDYGFSKMTLNYRLSESKYEKPEDDFSHMPVNIKKDIKEDEIYHNWDIAKLNPAAGDVISYYLEISDNDNISGPKSVKSELYTLRFPTLDDLFGKAEKDEENIEKEMKDLLEESEKLKDDLKKTSDELKKDKKELTWEEKNKIENNLENLKKMESRIDDVKKKLSDIRKDMAKNDLLSEETMQKYMELQNLFNEMNSEELKLAVERLQDALKSMMRDKAQQALENFRLDEEQLRSSIERTLNLLKKIKVEQKIDELLKRTGDLADKISDIEKQIKNGSLNDKDKNTELQKRQENVTEDIDKLGAEMEKTDESMKELDDMPLKEMEKLIEEFKKQKNDELSKMSESDIKEGKKESALNNEKKMMDNLSSTGKLISDVKKSFLEKNQMQTFRQMMKMLDNLLSLSKSQESLRKETEKLQPNSNQYTEKLHAQNDLKSGLLRVIEQITELSQNTFSITPEMGKALGKALQEMEKSVSILQNKGSYSLLNQRNAMDGLNQAAMLMKRAMDKMMSGGKGGGMMSLMQQLQQLSGDQMSLNQLTDQLNKGDLSMQEQGQMQRLAQQQELIRKSLEQLNREAKEAGQSKSLAGSLDKALSEMQEVIKELKGDKLSNDLVKQQERILSRMLDAQRSMNERDFEKNRESKSGTGFDRLSPGQLNLQDKSKNKLRDELLKAIKEGYKKDYEELIKRYFELLEKEQSKK